MKKTPQNKRNSVISLLKNGCSLREVSNKLKIGKSTVARIRNEAQLGPTTSKIGRPRILSKTDETYCVQKVTRKRVSSAVKVTKDLENELGIKCNPETVRRVLRSRGLGAIEKPKKPMLKQRHVKARLAWCKAHEDWTMDDWKRVVWTDETKINRFNSDGRQWTWIRCNEELQNHHCKLTVKHGGGSIMLWSAITYAGVGWICRISGNMDKTLYKEILQDDLEQTINYTCGKLGLRRDQIIFQQDNDPKHTSNLVKDYLKEQSYKVMEWPAQSPDLNPIENMWSLLKRRLNEFDSAPKGMEDLNERVTKVWYEQMKEEECQKVIESMPKRIKACIEAKGRWTKY
jgi:transposase